VDLLRRGTLSRRLPDARRLRVTRGLHAVVVGLASARAAPYSRTGSMSRSRTGPARRRNLIDERTRTAYHEAGHAVLSAAINDTPHRVSIRPDEGTLGRTSQWMTTRPTTLAQVYLAGFAAEHLLTGRRSRQLNVEVGLAILSVADPDLGSAFGGEGSDGYGAVAQVLRTGVREVEDDIRRVVERLYDVARNSLSVVWDAVDAMAFALLQADDLDRSMVQGILGEFDMFNPVLRVQRAHGLMPAPTLSVSQRERGPLSKSSGHGRTP
jgi:hypothetical protein